MALVSISEAAKLARKNRSTLYRDIEKGRLSKTVLPEGETKIEISELVRAYGHVHLNGKDAAANDASRDQVRIMILEEKIRSLERVITLEAELRRVKDQVTNELRAQLIDKDKIIKVLENKVLFLEYDQQTQLTSSKETEKTPEHSAKAEIKTAPPRKWWSRFFKKI